MDIKKFKAHELNSQNPYIAYTEAYPPKTAYREFPSPLNISDLWQNEDMRHLTLSLHVPFDVHDCRYVNSFNILETNQKVINPFIDSMEIQGNIIQSILNSFQRSLKIEYIEIDGGAPSLLNVNQIHRVLDIIETIFHTSLKTSDLSISLHPDCNEEILEILLERHTRRINLRVQSFLEKELKRLHQFISLDAIEEGLELIFSMGFPHVNFDLVYGIDDQTESDFLISIERAISYEPDEFHLYPLYPHPISSLEQPKNQRKDDIRMTLYQKGRQRLLNAGFIQDSMRRFVKKDTMRVNTSLSTDNYSFITDGMIGLGCGSRSYTKEIHYSEPYAVSQLDISRILHNYIFNPSDFDYAKYGILLTEEDKRRRFILKSLLKIKGLDIDSYRRYFKGEPQKEFPELIILLDNDLAYKNGNFIKLTEEGLSLSDIIGPWLYSQNVIDLIEDFFY